MNIWLCNRQSDEMDQSLEEVIVFTHISVKSIWDKFINMHSPDILWVLEFTTFWESGNINSISLLKVIQT